MYILPILSDNLFHAGTTARPCWKQRKDKRKEELELLHKLAIDRYDRFSDIDSSIVHTWHEHMALPHGHSV